MTNRYSPDVPERGLSKSQRAILWWLAHEGRAQPGKDGIHLNAAPIYIDHRSLDRLEARGLVARLHKETYDHYGVRPSCFRMLVRLTARGVPVAELQKSVAPARNRFGTWRHNAARWAERHSVDIGQNGRRETTVHFDAALMLTSAAGQLTRAATVLMATQPDVYERLIALTAEIHHLSAELGLADDHGDKKQPT